MQGAAEDDEADERQKRQQQVQTEDKDTIRLRKKWLLKKLKKQVDESVNLL